MKRGARVKAPDLHIACGCGAQWHGWYAVENPVIVAHRERERYGRDRSGVRDERCRVTVAGEGAAVQEAWINRETAPCR